MKTICLSRKSNDESGFILVTVLLMIVVMSLIGITSMIVASNEVLIAGNINKSKEAFYVTEAAQEEAKYYVLNDPTKGSSTAIGTNTLTDTSQMWNIDEFAGMILIDNAMNIHLILSNDANTLTLDDQPLAGSYAIAFGVLDDGQDGINGTGVTNKLTVFGQAWSINQWSGYLLVDAMGAEFTIIGNGTDYLDVAGTPASGIWSIVGNIGTQDLMTIKNPSYTLPAYISNDPQGWILTDENNNKFNIEDFTGFGVGDITLETGAGTPGHGTFFVSRPGWMYDYRSPIYGGGTISLYSTYYTIGQGMGYGEVTIQKTGTSKWSYEISAVGTVGKSKKRITMSIIDSGGGDTLFRDWREVAP